VVKLGFADFWDYIDGNEDGATLAHPLPRGNDVVDVGPFGVGAARGYPIRQRGNEGNGFPQIFHGSGSTIGDFDALGVNTRR
jgi:hypothetical protein